MHEALLLVMAWLMLGAIIYLMGSFVAGLFRSPFVPSSGVTVRRMVELAKLQPHEHAVDLGCGDGRILRAAAATGVTATGYEISYLVWLIAWVRNLFSPYRQRMQLIRGNMYQANLKKADVVFCYLLPATMQRLEEKFLRELKPGARIVSAAFSLPNMQPTIETERVGGVSTVRLYVVPERKKKVVQKKVIKKVTRAK